MNSETTSYLVDINPWEFIYCIQQLILTWVSVLKSNIIFLEILEAWALPIIILVCFLILIIVASKRGTQHALYSKSLPFKTFDDTYSMLKSKKEISKLDFKNGKSIYFEIDDMKQSINWPGKNPYFKTLAPTSGALFFIFLPLGILPSVIEERIATESIADKIYILIILTMFLLLFKERKNIKNMWSKDYKLRLKIQHDELVDFLSA